MQFLLADSGISGLLTALGIDWKVLLLNTAAFLVIVWVMGRFVYPPLMRALDAKLAELEATSRAKKEADQKLGAAEGSAAEIIGQARKSADEILAEARDAADALLKTTEQKAEAQAQRIITEAREQLVRDVEAARNQLRSETAQLVATATETILEEKLDDQRDASLIARVVGGHK